MKKMSSKKTKTCSFHSIKPCDLSRVTKSEVKQYFENTYDLYENLFLGLKDCSSYYKYPDALRLPLIFYYGHTAALYVNKLVLAGLLKDRISFEYESLFETGVDEMSWDDIENYRMGGEFVWPKVSAVTEYRRKVRDTILDVIDRTPLELPITEQSPWWAIFMGVEHERIHLETSSVLIRQLPIDLVEKPPNWTYGPRTSGTPVTENPLLGVDATHVTLGKPRDFPSYGWDNEYGKWTVRVPPFEASKFLITNREFLEFVQDGGYEDKHLWSEGGWRWRSFRQARHPTFWVCNQACKSGCGADLRGYSHCRLATDVNSNEHDGIKYQYRAMFDILELPLDWPAEVNYHEAKAYCAWKGPGYRLLTEAEHHAIRGPQKPVSNGTECDIIHQVDRVQANINIKFGSSTPVNLYPPRETGFCDVSGNTWCWLEDHYNGLPGFSSHYLYNDFSGPPFDGRHQMIMVCSTGTTWVVLGFLLETRDLDFHESPLGHTFSSISDSAWLALLQTRPLPVRLVSTEVFVLGAGVQERSTQIPGVSDEAWLPSTNNQYCSDTEEQLSSELVKQYGSVEVSPFMSHCIEVAKEYNGTGQALHLLCSVGRDSWALAKHFDKVVAIDFSGRLIDAALRLQKGEKIACHNQQSLDYVALAETTDPNRVVFKQFTWLPIEIGTFDFVAFTGLHRLDRPKAWLVRMREIVTPNGTLIIDAHRDWDVQALASLLGKRYKYLGCKPSVFVKREGTSKEDRCHGSVTIWRKI